MFMSRSSGTDMGTQRRTACAGDAGCLHDAVLHYEPQWARHRLTPRSHWFCMVALTAVIWLALNIGRGAQAQAPCTPPVLNPIVCENAKSGNPPSEWDISGAGASSI